GVAFAERARAVNPTCHIAFYGLYASLNAEYLLKHAADSVLSGEVEDALVALAQTLETERRSLPAPGTILKKLEFAVPSRTQLPSLKKYAHVERNGRLELAGYVEASRGCKHLCRHCPTRCWPTSPRATRAPISSRRSTRCVPRGSRCAPRGCRSRRGRRSTTTGSFSTSSRPTR